MIKKLIIITIPLLLIFKSIYAQPGKVLSYQRLSYKEGGLTIAKDSNPQIGSFTCFLGDLDKDGTKEIFTITQYNYGIGHILSLKPDGTVKKRVTIGRNKGLPDNAAGSWNTFGTCAANIGDINKDGVTDLGIGSSSANEIFILFLNANGTIKDYKRIRTGENGFNTNLLNIGDNFGSSLINIGDIDKNRTIELVIGAPYTDDGANEAGAIWILSLDSTGYCTDYKKISHNSGGGSILGINKLVTRFGLSGCKYQDIDGDGIEEFFIGAPYVDINLKNKGLLYGISINSNKTMKYFKCIADTSINFGDTFKSNAYFSYYLASLGDIDGNGINDIVCYGANENRGQAKVLLFNESFKIKSNLKWDSLYNGLPAYTSGYAFGSGLSGINDLNGDGRLDAIVGLPLDDRNSYLYGAIYVLFLDGKQYNSSISTHLKDDRLMLFPNPLNKQSNLNIELPNEFINHEIEIRIVNSVGQEIALSEYKINNNLATIEKIDIESGVYYITVSSQNIEYFYKLIIE